jgi:hypothetical protein
MITGDCIKNILAAMKFKLYLISVTSVKISVPLVVNFYH